MALMDFILRAPLTGAMVQAFLSSPLRCLRVRLELILELPDYPAFVESADFRLLSVAPSGWYYNFADCGDTGGTTGDITLAWFAKQNRQSAIS